MAQKKIHRLEGTHELPFVLIALSCHENLLKTVWSINKLLSIDLRESAIPIEVKENPLQTFPVFCDRETSSVRFYSLISNKTSGYLLVKELPHIDFIFEISGEIKKSDIPLIIKEIKGVPGIIVALEVDPKKIKRKTAFCPI